MAGGLEGYPTPEGGDDGNLMRTRGELPSRQCSVEKVASIQWSRGGGQHTIVSSPAQTLPASPPHFLRLSTLTL